MSEGEQEIKQEEGRQEKDDHRVSSPITEREYILRGRSVTLMVQLFCIQEQYEMRLLLQMLGVLACIFFCALSQISGPSSGSVPTVSCELDCFPCH